MVAGNMVTAKGMGWAMDLASAQGIMAIRSESGCIIVAIVIAAAIVVAEVIMEVD